MQKKIYKTMEKYKHVRGFSLIEVLVSMSIFAIVTVVGVGALLVLIDANTRAQNSQSIITNLSFALDSMTREIRTGRDYFCTSSESTLPTSGNSVSDCVGGGSFLSFNEGGQSLTGSESSRRIGFKLNNGILERRLGTNSWIPITTSTITINSLQFYVNGTVRGDTNAPVVTVYLSGTLGNDINTQTKFNLQTTVSQELLDI